MCIVSVKCMMMIDETVRCCFGKPRNCVINQFRFENLELDFYIRLVCILRFRVSLIQNKRLQHFFDEIKIKCVLDDEKQTEK